MTPSAPLPLVYIAGPFRGPNPLAVRRNVERARDAGIEIAHAGAYPIIPHTMTADFDKLLTDQFWLDGTMELLKRCDAIYLITDWQLSSGARAEREAAQALGMPVFYDVVQVEAWVQVRQVNAERQRANGIVQV